MWPFSQKKWADCGNQRLKLPTKPQQLRRNSPHQRWKFKKIGDDDHEMEISKYSLTSKKEF